MYGEILESLWVPPSCGYLSLAEQEAQAFVTTKKQLQVCYYI